MLTAMGSVVSVGIYQPLVAILSGGVTAIFSKIIFPIFLLLLIFIILNNLSGLVKLNKFISFLSSTFKWIVGFVFTMFAGLLTIQGISAGRYDTISLKATRFAMKSYIPIIGGYLSDGLDYVMLSSVLIKNAIGVAGIILLIMTILIPIINILILKLGLQFVAGVIETMGNSKISGLCDDLSKVLICPIVVILAMAFMYFLSVGLMMCTISGV
jgi:stage III sporulation protein AE